MSKTLKLEISVADLGQNGVVVSEFATTDYVANELSKKATLNAEGKVDPSLLPDYTYLDGLVDKLDDVEQSFLNSDAEILNAAKLYSDNKIAENNSKKADLVEGKVPFEQLPFSMNFEQNVSTEFENVREELRQNSENIVAQMDGIVGSANSYTDGKVLDEREFLNNTINEYKGEVNSQLNNFGNEVDNILKSGASLPYDPDLEYVEGALTLKDGEIQQFVEGVWVPFNKTVDASDVKDESGLSQQEWNNGVESIAELLAIQNPKNGSRVYVKAYRSGWAVEAIYHGPKGGGWFAYNAAKAAVNDGIHCFNGWERIDYDKYYVNTDIAGFYGDAVNDDFESFMRVNRYIITLDFWSPKTFEMMSGNFLISSFTDECIIIPQYGLTTLCTVTGNMTIKGQGKVETKITYGFDYLAWMYAKFTTAYELNAGLISNPLHCTFSPNATYVSHIKGINIESFSVDLKGDVYYYNQEQATKSQEGKAFCSISPMSWALNTIQDIKVTDLKTIRNPSMQNIAFNNSLAYTDNVIIHGTEHEYCGEASSLLNKCPDHSSIYCNGNYTKITGGKFVSSRASTINCAIEFHGSGEISDNEFIDCAAPLYAVNLQGYQGGTFNELIDNTEVTIKNNKVRGAIYGIGYANGGKMTLNIEDNNIKLRKEKSNSAWVNGKVYVHGGLDARGLINLSETENSYIKVIGSGNTFEQEEPNDWTTEDRYINSCIATKNIQELTWTDNTFINFKGSILVLEKQAVTAIKKTKINMSGNTYINCGSQQDPLKPHLVTDSIVYPANSNILDFSNAAVNTAYGSVNISNETFIDCKYTRAITQLIYNVLFENAKVRLETNGMFLTPVSFVNAYANADSYTDYSINMDFGEVSNIPATGLGYILKGYSIDLTYTNSTNSARKYVNHCVKMKQLSTINTVSTCFNSTGVVAGDIPNGAYISDRDAVYFPLNRSNEVQKVNYNSSTSSWS